MGYLRARADVAQTPPSNELLLLPQPKDPPAGAPPCQHHFPQHLELLVPGGGRSAGTHDLKPQALEETANSRLLLDKGGTEVTSGASVGQRDPGIEDSGLLRKDPLPSQAQREAQRGPFFLPIQPGLLKLTSAPPGARENAPK